MNERRSHRQICSVCNREYAIDFSVPNYVWELATHESQRHNLICLDCFVRMADTRLVEWEHGLTVYPTSLVTHLKQSGWVPVDAALAAERVGGDQ